MVLPNLERCVLKGMHTSWSYSSSFPAQVLGLRSLRTPITVYVNRLMSSVVPIGFVIDDVPQGARAHGAAVCGGQLPNACSGVCGTLGKCPLSQVGPHRRPPH